MNIVHLTMDTKTNVGMVDRVIRFVLGSALIAVPLFYQGVDAEYAALTSLFAIPLMFTAMVRWCPVYAFLHVQSIKHIYNANRFYTPNVSTVDAVFRITLASILIMITMVFTSVTDPWLVLPALMAIPVMHSAIMQWDPLYAVLEISSAEKSIRSNAGKTENATIIAFNSAEISDHNPDKPVGSKGKKAA